MATRFISMTIPCNLVEEPLMFRLGKSFRVVPNIFKAKVERDEGWVVLEISGEDSEIDRAVTYLKNKGLLIEEGGRELLKKTFGKKLRRIRVRLVLPDKTAKRAVLHEICEKFQVVTNIRRAEVTEDSGWIELEIDGDSTSIDQAVDYLKEMKVSVNPIEGDIVE